MPAASATRSTKSWPGNPFWQARLDDPLDVVKRFVEVVRSAGVRDDELALVSSELYDLQNSEVAA